MSYPNIYIPLIRRNKNDHFDMSLFKCQNQSGAGISSASHDKKKVQVGKDQEKAQSEKDSHSKNRGGKKPN